MEVHIRYWELITAVAALAFMQGLVLNSLATMNHKLDKIESHIEKIETRLDSMDVRISLLEKK